jgi:hypothetical protein
VGPSAHAGGLEHDDVRDGRQDEHAATAGRRGRDEADDDSGRHRDEGFGRGDGAARREDGAHQGERDDGGGRYADPHEGMAEEGQGGHDAPPPAGEGRLRQRAASRRPLRQGQGHADASADRCAEEHAEGRVGVAPLVLGHGYLPRHGAGTACAAPLEDARDRSAP